MILSVPAVLVILLCVSTFAAFSAGDGSDDKNNYEGYLRFQFSDGRKHNFFGCDATHCYRKYGPSTYFIGTCFDVEDDMATLDDRWREGFGQRAPAPTHRARRVIRLISYIVALLTGRIRQR